MPVDGQSVPLINAGFMTLDTAQVGNYNSYLYLKTKYGGKFTVDGTFYSFSASERSDIGIHLNKHDRNGNIIGYGLIGADTNNNILINSLSITNQSPTVPLYVTRGCANPINLIQNTCNNTPRLYVEAKPAACDPRERILFNAANSIGAIPLTLNEGGVSSSSGVGVLKIPAAGFALDVNGPAQYAGGVLPATSNVYTLGSSNKPWSNVWTGSDGIHIGPVSYISADASGNVTIYKSVTIGGNTDFNGDILPGTTYTYKIGSSNAVWKDLWVGSNSIHIGSVGTVGAYGASAGTIVAGTISVQPGLKVDGLTTLNGDVVPLTTAANNLGTGTTNAWSNLWLSGTANIGSVGAITTNVSSNIKISPGLEVAGGNIFPGTSAAYSLGTGTGSAWSNLWLSDTANIGAVGAITTNASSNIKISPGLEVAGVLTGNSNIVPGTTSVYSLGTGTGSAWSNLWLSGTANFGAAGAYITQGTTYPQNIKMGTSLQVDNTVTAPTLQVTSGATYYNLTAAASTVQITNGTTTGVLFDTQLNQPVKTLTTSGSGISVNQTSGDVTISNTGVTQITAGTNITISPTGGTGNVTINSLSSKTFNLIVGATVAGLSPAGPIVAGTEYTLTITGYNSIFSSLIGGGGGGGGGGSRNNGPTHYAAAGGGGGGSGFSFQIATDYTSLTSFKFSIGSGGGGGGGGQQPGSLGDGNPGAGGSPGGSSYIIVNGSTYTATGGGGGGGGGGATSIISNGGGGGGGLTPGGSGGTISGPVTTNGANGGSGGSYGGSYTNGGIGGQYGNVGGGAPAGNGANATTVASGGGGGGGSAGSEGNGNYGGNGGNGTSGSIYILFA